MNKLWEYGWVAVKWQLINGQNLNWQLTKSLKYNWQLAFALGFTDNWQRIVTYFVQNPFKSLNSIVPLFSSDDVIKCAFLGVILTARRLSVSISLMIYCKTHVMYHLCKNDLWSQIYAPLRTRQHTTADSEGVTKAIASFFRDDSDTVFLSIYVPIIYSEGINFDWHNGRKCWTLG